MTRAASLLLVSSLVILGPACDVAKTPEPTVVVTPPRYGEHHERLSQWHLFKDLPEMVPMDGVVPYDVNAPLFTDYTKKFRWIFVPAGAKATYSADDVYDLPVGSVLVKAFTYPADERDPKSPLQRLETRILFREPDGWDAQTYVWDADGRDATRKLAGPRIPTSFIDANGVRREHEYTVPNTEQCKSCHMTGNVDTTGMNAKGVLAPIGVRTRELARNHDYGALGSRDQIDHLASLGVFSEPPPPASQREALVDPFGDADLGLRVRSYWDSNCAHCHRTGGLANTYGLHLDFASTDPASNPPSNWGVCKVAHAAPGACGNLQERIDVVPGDPARSFMVCRMAAALDGPDAKVHMPPLGAGMVHDEAVALVSEWMAALPPDPCGSAPAP